MWWRLNGGHEGEAGPPCRSRSSATYTLARHPPKDKSEGEKKVVEEIENQSAMDEAKKAAQGTLKLYNQFIAEKAPTGSLL